VEHRFLLTKPQQGRLNKGKVMEIIFILIGLIVGGISPWLVQRYRFASKSISLEKAEEL